LSSTHTELARKIEDLEERLDGHDEKILAIFAAAKKLADEDENPKHKIGYIGQNYRIEPLLHKPNKKEVQDERKN